MPSSTRPGHHGRRGADAAGRGLRGPWLFLAEACLIGIGCTGSSDVPVYSVTGQLKVKGEPASGAFLVFHPLDAPKAPPPTGSGGATAEPVRPSALVKPDGSFQLTSFSGGDGAPAGDYAVTLEWHKTIVPPAYAKPESTPLKVTVKPGPNSLPPWNITR